MKPIEKGCLAVVIQGLGAGCEVEVGDFLGECPGFVGSDYWDVTRPNLSPSVLPVKEGYIARECLLMRINGYDSSQDVEEIEEELTHETN